MLNFKNRLRLNPSGGFCFKVIPRFGVSQMRQGIFKFNHLPPTHHTNRSIANYAR